MSRQAHSVHRDNPDRNKVHQDKIMRKVQKIEGLKALLEEWETCCHYDHAYILKLRAKLRSAENQLAAMSI